MELLKQSKKYDFKIYLKYDRFNEPYYSIENYKSSYVKENVSIRLDFNLVIKKAIEIYKKNEAFKLPF